MGGPEEPLRAGGPDVWRGRWKRRPLHIEGLWKRGLGHSAPWWNTVRLGPLGAKVHCRDRRSL